MDFGWSPEENGFRLQVRAFIREQLPADWDELALTEEESYQHGRRYAVALAGRKWRVMHWPVEFGGLGYNHWRHLIFSEEAAYHRFPGASDMGTGFVGPTLMLFGDERQKQRFLPAIADATVQFCQLFTEPGAGSDLGSLQTRAVRDGDDYVVTGQKIFTSGGHHADWGWLGARTNQEAPKHRGISTFLIDMKSPGVTVRPLINMTGQHIQNEVFFDEVRIPSENLVGEENRGWYQMASTLDFERARIGWFAGARRMLDDMVGFARTASQGGRVLGKRPEVRFRLADLAVALEVGRFLAYRTVWMLEHGDIPNKEASAAKAFSSETNQRLANFGVSMLGLYGTLQRDSKHALLRGRLEQMYKETVFYTVAAGSSEIQRNIIATRGLGLPR
ncbi:MAG: acyl-CoA dehydrogenase [Dehalococcoidia bacterium]|nr:acyl-CoA dehydrogenase [Dehalococcoidia bacterium]